MIRILGILLMAIIIAGCHKSKNNFSKSQRKYVSSDSVTLNSIEKASNFKDLFVQKRIIHLQTIPESLIGVIESVIYLPNEGKIIVLDNKVAKSIFVFGIDGKFLYKIGKNGEGPGEYIIPDHITYGNNKIIVFSQNGFKLLNYNLDGKFIKEISFPANNWNFYVDDMCLWNNDLYIYDNNEAYDEGPDGNIYRVFRIKGCANFDSSYGEYENTLDFDGGGITEFNKRIVYSSIFNGYIYQILPGERKPSILTSLGTLTNISNYTSLPELLKDIRNIDLIINIGSIKNLLFVQRKSGVTIIDDSGRILKNLSYSTFKLPDGYENTDLRTGFIFYNEGIIFASTEKSEIMETKIPNPSLIFYELK